MIKIYLDNLEYRYDVYQIVNLFFNFEEITFDGMEYDYKISTGKDNKYISIYHGSAESKYNVSSEISYKQNIKNAIFQYFTALTGMKLPWGTLVGIRPSKIALSLIGEDKEENQIIEYFHTHYLTSKEKSRLCIEVAREELRLVNKESSNISVYIGMPFCPTRCVYCSFASNPIKKCEKLVKPYLQALNKEITAVSNYINNKQLTIQTVYFGGGTPTSVDNEDFEYIMKSVYEKLIRGRDIQEFTVECGRPDSITYEKLRTMKRYMVDRISINPQTMNNDTLKRIGRNHSAEDVVLKFNQARELGFDNINMDIIVGLQGENAEHIEKTCQEIFKLNPDSLTVHGMSIKRASRLHENIVTGSSTEILSQRDILNMYERTILLSKELNMKPYYMYRQKNMVGNMENIGYCSSGKECIYNVQMMEEKQTIIALGADAVSKVVFLEENRIERFANIKDVKVYVDRIDEMIIEKIKLLDTLYTPER